MLYTRWEYQLGHVEEPQVSLEFFNSIFIAFFGQGLKNFIKSVLIYRFILNCHSNEPMTRYLTLFVLFLLSALSTLQNTPNYTGSLIFSQKKTTIRQNTTHYIIQLYCESRIGQCRFDYTFLPLGWVSDQNELAFQKQLARRIWTYPVKVNISEITGDWITKDLFILLENGRISVEGRTVSTNIRSNPVEISMPKTPSYQVQDINPMGYVSAPKNEQELPQAQKFQEILESKSYDQLTIQIHKLLRYPSSSSSIHPCPQTYFQFLNEQILPLLNKYNQQYSTQEQMKSKESEMLEQEIERIDQDMLSMELMDQDELEAKLAELNLEYIEQQKVKNKAFNVYYSSNIIASKYLQRINEIIPMALSIEDKKQVEELKVSISKDEQRLNEIQEKMRALKAEQMVIYKRVNYDKDRLQKLQKNSNESMDEKRLKSLETSHKLYQDRAMENKKIYESSLMKLQELQQQINDLKEGNKKQQQKMAEMKEQMKQKSRDLDEVMSSKKQVDRFMTPLKNSITKIKDQIEQCQVLGIKQIEQPKVDTTIPVQNSQFVSRVELRPVNVPLEQVRPTNELVRPISIPQLKVQPARSPTITSNLRIPQPNKLSKVNIFSSSWILNNGVPKPQLFSCRNFQVSQSGYILAVTYNGFRVLSPSGHIKLLVFSVCTDILVSSPLEVPLAGDFIEWKGEQSFNGEYKLYSAAVYRAQKT